MQNAVFLQNADVPLRDIRLTMAHPFFCVQNRRETPISFRRWVEKKEEFVKVIPGAGEGLPTIHDLDFLICLLGMVNDRHEREAQLNATVCFRPATMLRAMRRHRSGADYRRLMATIRRLRATTIITNVFEGLGACWQQPYSWISDCRIPISRRPPDDWGQGGDLCSDALWYVTLSPNLLACVSDKTQLLAVNPDFLMNRSGIEKALYRIARKSVSPVSGAWNWRLETLHDRCALDSPMVKFRKKLSDLAAKDRPLPDYGLKLGTTGRSTSVTFIENKSLSRRRGLFCG